MTEVNYISHLDFQISITFKY